MQPGPPPEHHQSGPPPYRPAAGSPPASAQWSAPPSSASTPRAAQAAADRRGRPGLIVVVALLVEVIVIAAADNQWVAQRLSDNALSNTGAVGHDLTLSVLTYQWRFSPSSNDVFHILYAQYALLAVVLVGTALLVLAAARGEARFARVFFGAWTGVIAASGVGSMVRGFVLDSRMLGGQSRLRFALFSDIGPTQYVFVGALALGMLVGLAAGLTAVMTRRRAEPEAGRVAEPVPEPVPAVPAQRDVDSRDEAPTTQFERPRTEADATQQFSPVRDEPDPADATAEPEPTQAMPRVEGDRRDSW